MICAFSLEYTEMYMTIVLFLRQIKFTSYKQINDKVTLPVRCEQNMNKILEVC